MCILLADGPPLVEVKNEIVTITMTSGGETYAVAFTLPDAHTAIADFFELLEQREGREANVLAYKARG